MAEDIPFPFMVTPESAADAEWLRELDAVVAQARHDAVTEASLASITDSFRREAVSGG